MYGFLYRSRELLEADAGGKGGGGGGGRGFDVSKSGDTRVGFVGFPSVGKSTLLTKLTGTHSEAAAYEVKKYRRVWLYTCFACFSGGRGREGGCQFNFVPIFLSLVC